MNLVVFDIGGSAVKTGLWQSNELHNKQSFATPDTFELLLGQMKEMIESFSEMTIDGIAISAPGAVNVDKGIIEGISAVPYLHDRPIVEELEQALELPVTIENDANCAGICEMAKGAGKDVKHAVFLVLGTGVGGAVFINRQLYKGAHLFGGEFGLMTQPNRRILSMEGTAVKGAIRYSQEKNIEVTGKELFEIKEQGDALAQQILSEMYQNIAEVLYNIQVSLDPEMVIIGGGISVRRELPTELSQRLNERLTEQGISEIMPEIVSCAYRNEANLIGAAINFMTVQANRVSHC